ncbi:MAG: OmpA family protein [Sulfurospirillum sp.]|nr:OmpA family protein [Sulfurospirillum sp.]
MKIFFGIFFYAVTSLFGFEYLLEKTFLQDSSLIKDELMLKKLEKQKTASNAQELLQNSIKIKKQTIAFEIIRQMLNQKNDQQKKIKTILENATLPQDNNATKALHVSLNAQLQSEFLHLLALENIEDGVKKLYEDLALFSENVRDKNSFLLTKAKIFFLTGTLVSKLKEAQYFAKIHFSSNDTNISSYSMSLLAWYAKKMREMEKAKIELTGHSDILQGSLENEKLALQRAEETKKALVSFGLEAKNITTKTHSDLYPIASQETPQGRLLNRRVTIKIIEENN